jgi:hypothetical protein
LAQTATKKLRQQVRKALPEQKPWVAALPTGEKKVLG